MKRTIIVAALSAVIAASAVAIGQTHWNLTNNQAFTVSNGKSLTGTYQCSGAGSILDCPLSGTTTFSGTFISGTFGKTSTNGTDGIFTCAGAGDLTSNCYFNGNYVFGNAVVFNAGISTTALSVAGPATTSFAAGSTVNFSGPVQANTLPTISATKTVRNSAGSGTCTLEFTRGMLTASTC